MAQRVDCVVAGHICLDVTPLFLSAGPTVGEIFRPGTLVNVGPATVSTGGPVSNTGFPLRRLGNAVKLMGKCGDDMFGRALIEKIKAEAPGAEAGMQCIAGEQTSYTVVISPPGIDRMFLHCPGANDTFGAADVDLAAVAEARLFHFGYPPLMARTYADGGAELVKMFQGAKATGATTSLDTAYPDPSGPAARADWSAILQKTLPHVDIFTPSVEELLLMLRPRDFGALARRGNGDVLSQVDGRLLNELGGQCLGWGAGIVLIKCGWHGLYVRTADKARLSTMGRGQVADPGNWAAREIFEPGYKVAKVVSTTGAGDCAIAAFLTAVLRGCNIELAMHCAAAVGAQNVTAADSISGVRTWEETLAQIESRPAKYEVTLKLDLFARDAQQCHYTGPNNG